MTQPQPHGAYGTGNVFSDLGLDHPEDRLAKADLASRLVLMMEDLGLPQAEFANRLNIPEERLATIVRGRLDGTSVEDLVRLIARAGVNPKALPDPA